MDSRTRDDACIMIDFSDDEVDPLNSDCQEQTATGRLVSHESSSCFIDLTDDVPESKPASVGVQGEVQAPVVAIAANLHCLPANNAAQALCLDTSAAEVTRQQAVWEGAIIGLPPAKRPTSRSPAAAAAAANTMGDHDHLHENFNTFIEQFIADKTASRTPTSDMRVPHGFEQHADGSFSFLPPRKKKAGCNQHPIPVFHEAGQWKACLHCPPDSNCGMGGCDVVRANARGKPRKDVVQMRECATCREAGEAFSWFPKELMGSTHSKYCWMHHRLDVAESQQISSTSHKRKEARAVAAAADAQLTKAEAEQVVKRFVSGKENKCCRTCSLWRPVELFYLKSKSADGLAGSCRVCKEQHMSASKDYVRILLHANVKGRLKRLGQGQQQSVTSKPIADLLGYQLDDLVQHLQDKLQELQLLKSDGVTQMTMEDWRSKDNKGQQKSTADFWTLGHIQPLAHYDLSSEEGIRACWALNNLRPEVARLNYAYGDSIH